MTTAAVHTIPLETDRGEITSLTAFRGRAVMIVNIASRCGFTPQLATLEDLHQTYGPRGLTVIGVPCNQFAGQEPGSAEQIRTFCSTTYGVSFPLMAKTDVNGPARHSLYDELTRTPDADGDAGDVRWNFEKFLIAPDGTVAGRFRSATAPDAPEVLAAIEAVVPG